MYTKQLPTKTKLERIARLIRPFPTTAARAIDHARYLDDRDDTIDFLEQFDPDTIFDNREDFLISCEELKLLIKEERKMPYEHLRSPQD